MPRRPAPPPRTSRSSLAQTRTLLACVTVGAALAVLTGCGGSSSPSTSPPSTATTAPAPGSPGAAAVAACKHAVQVQTTIDTEVKAKLEGLCAKAANGNEQEIKKAATVICEEAVKGSSIPAGAERESALNACRRS